MRRIERRLYMDRLRALKGTPEIKVITGMRRSGKSDLMNMFATEVAEDEKANVVMIDLLDLDNEPLKEYHALHSFINSSYREGLDNCLFIDEIQLCDGFELAVNGIHSRGQWDIYITGSNAFLLSSDLATLFTGRHVELHVLPFSFAEYVEYHEAFENASGLLDEYVRRGGLAGSYNYQSESDADGYVRDVYKTIITRDLVQKFNLPGTRVLERLSEYMMDNAGNLNSPNGISNALTANKEPTNHVTIGKYMSHLRDAFLFYEAKRYDIRGKKYLETSEKNYLCDTGMRYAVLGTRNMDWGRMYENLVFLELMRRRYETYVGKLYQKEIDFVAKKGSELIYIQVSDDVSSESTFKREVEPLLAIRDAHPKLLIARTGHPASSYEGVEIVDIAQWLLS